MLATAFLESFVKKKISAVQDVDFPKHETPVTDGQNSQQGSVVYIMNMVCKFAPSIEIASYLFLCTWSLCKADRKTMFRWFWVNLIVTVDS